MSQHRDIGKLASTARDIGDLASAAWFEFRIEHRTNANKRPRPERVVEHRTNATKISREILQYAPDNAVHDVDYQDQLIDVREHRVYLELNSKQISTQVQNMLQKYEHISEELNKKENEYLDLRYNEMGDWNLKFPTLNAAPDEEAIEIVKKEMFELRNKAYTASRDLGTAQHHKRAIRNALDWTIKLESTQLNGTMREYEQIDDDC